MMENKNKSLHDYAKALNDWLVDSQPNVREIPEFIGKGYFELESLYPSEYIAHDANNGNLELMAPEGTINCAMRDGVCIRAIFADNSDDEDDESDDDKQIDKELLRNLFMTDTEEEKA